MVYLDLDLDSAVAGLVTSLTIVRPWFVRLVNKKDGYRQRNVRQFLQSA